MDVSTLNLSRKWRSQTFDALIGQEIVVKILKNSLYTSHYFPVYLFAGQRGCGKTSTARIFAAALNCLQLKEFQEKPKDTVLPCGICQSCVAMKELRHPDFIEIDAASHTGVDNMRSIIDVAYYMPVLGHKKIYLIDEAHMLSKAAFNALLKILEEPPVHAHFILATTDPEKIIETVRSRCFTLFFDAIDYTILAQHLEHVCMQERIQYVHDALVYIARASDGSARDALNMLETIRFSHPEVSKEAVLQVLGHVDDQHLAHCMRYVSAGDTQLFLKIWNTALVSRASATHMWASLVRITRAMIWHRYEVASHDVDMALIHELSDIESSFFEYFLHTLYQTEPLFIRTRDQRGMLELMFLECCIRRNKNCSNDSSQNQQSSILPSVSPQSDGGVQHGEAHEHAKQFGDAENQKSGSSDIILLMQFKEKIHTLTDPMLISILSQIVTIACDKHEKRYRIHFSESHTFFADTLHEMGTQWHPLLWSVYAMQGTVLLAFDQPALNAQVTSKREAVVARVHATVVTHDVSQSQKVEEVVQPRVQQPFTRTAYQSKSLIKQEKKIDVSDVQRWPLVNRVLTCFPGTVTMVDEAQV